MNTARWERLASLLERAADLEPGERRTLLARECADDPPLAVEVEALIAAESRARGFLEPVPASTAPAPQAAVGARIGGYTLVRRVAAGGMGVVFEARQERPNRRVALKLVQSALADPATLRRFRYEAEALGRLRHPGIAQVYEAGVDVDANGEERPFLAMEFVDGAQPVTVHAREAGLSFDAIVRLFIPICAAVQHGHDRGVLHRDLKASNVLVDSSGAPKVIDFGVARVAGDQATRATLAGEIVGTLTSMSPEQLDGDSDAVDVRSDVYALGALLYELLCGVPPLDLRGLSITQALAKARASSPTPPSRLRQDLPLELEWIVLRALEPERDRRYASAADLARDLERFLGDEPVLASPPSAVYRVRKFVRRNRLLVGASLAVLAVVVAGSIAALVQRDRALAAKDRAEQAERLAADRLARLEVEARTNRELADFQGGILKSVDPDADGRDVRVVDVLARAGASLDARVGLDPGLELALRRSIFEAYFALGQPREADLQIQRMQAIWEARYAPDDPERLALERLRLDSDAFVAPANVREARTRDGLARATAAFGADSPQTAMWSLALAVALADLGRAEAAEPLARAALATLTARLGPAENDTIDARIVLGRILNDSKRFEEAETFKRDTYETCRAARGDDDTATLGVKKQLAFAIGLNGRAQEAVDMLREVVAGHTRRTGPKAAAALTARADLSEFLRRCRRYPEALAEIESALADGRETYGDRHPYVYKVRQRRAATLAALGRRDEAISELEGTLADAAADLGPDETTTLEVETGLVRACFEAGRHEEAIPYARDVWERSLRTLGTASATTLMRGNMYSVILAEAGRPEQSIDVMELVLEGQDRLLGPWHANSLQSLGNLSTTLVDVGEPAAAACRAGEWLARVRAKPGSSAADFAGAHWAFGRALSANGDHEGAAENFAIACSAWDRSRERVSRSAISALVDQAAELGTLGRREEERAVLERAGAMAFDASIPPDVAARALVSLAQHWRRCGEPDAARALAEYVLNGPRAMRASLRQLAEQIAATR